MFVSSPTSWHVLIHDCSWPSTNTLQDYGAAVNSLDFHRTEDLLITGCDDDSIRVYNTAEGSRVETLFSRKYGVSNIVLTHASSCALYATRKVRCAGWG
jgi:COMPASS component SWD2